MMPTSTTASVFYPRDFHAEICAVVMKNRPEHWTFLSMLNICIPDYKAMIPHSVPVNLIFALSLILVPPCLSSRKCKQHFQPCSALDAALLFLSKCFNQRVSCKQ